MKSVKLKYILCSVILLLIIAGILLSPHLYYYFVDLRESSQTYTDMQYQDSGEAITSVDEFIELYNAPSTRVFYVSTPMYSVSDNPIDTRVREEIGDLLLHFSEIKSADPLILLYAQMNDLELSGYDQSSFYGEVGSKPKSAEIVAMNYISSHGSINLIYSVDCGKIFSFTITSYDQMLMSETLDYYEIESISNQYSSYLDCEESQYLNVVSDYYEFSLELPLGSFDEIHVS